MSRLERLRTCLQSLLGDHSISLSDAEIVSVVLNCSLDAGQEWLAAFGAPNRSLTAMKSIAEQVGIDWRLAMDEAASRLQQHQDWGLDDAAPYAFATIVERLIEAEPAANNNRGDDPLH